MKPNKEILAEIDQIWTYHKNVRAHFPYARPEHIGNRFLESAPYYQSQGFKIKYDFGKVIEEQDIKYLNNLSNWLNQNALIRLYALMNYYKFVNENTIIDKSKPGWKELDILRRLRNKFSHTDGKLSMEDQEQIKLVDEIKNHFGLIESSFDHYPIPIDEVIEPIFNGCKLYVKSRK